MTQHTPVTTDATNPYDAPPAPGLRRFWMRIMTWAEDVPADLPFPCWTTSYSADYRLHPSKAVEASAMKLPEGFDVFDTKGLPDAVVDEFYVLQRAVCMLLDAEDPEAAWAVVEAAFPDAERQYCEPADDMTLDLLRAGGRFGSASTPSDTPKADDTPPPTQAPTAVAVDPYDAPPAPGSRRFWMRVSTWAEEIPDDLPFHRWVSGSVCRYRLRPSKLAEAQAAGLPSDVGVDLDVGGVSAETVDAFYVSQATVCILLDAADEEAAWSIVERAFPDGRRDFCEPADDTTLETLSTTGRFGRPKGRVNPS